MNESENKIDGRKGRSGRKKLPDTQKKTQICVYPRYIIVDRLGGHDAVKLEILLYLENKFNQLENQ